MKSNQQFEHGLFLLWWIWHRGTKGTAFSKLAFDAFKATDKFALVPNWDYDKNMRLITQKHINDYGAANPKAAGALQAWVAEAKSAVWKTPQDIKGQFKSASIIGNNRVVFNINGNNNRLIVGVDYRLGLLFVKFIGTHSEYDDIDAETVEQF